MSRSRDEWEDKMLNQLIDMFQEIGVPIDADQLRKMMHQMRDQFEKLGIDPERFAKGDVNLNIDLSSLSKMFSQGADINDMLTKMGVKVEVDAKPVEIEITDDEEEELNVIKLPAADVFLEGWKMVLTIDISMKEVVNSEHIELELISSGQILEVLRETQTIPVVSIELPHPCEELLDWSLNNGILDVTLKLTPQGSAIEELNDDSDDFDDLDDNTPDVNIDFGDDDDDDGGIPIL